MSARNGRRIIPIQQAKSAPENGTIAGSLLTSVGALSVMALLEISYPKTTTYLP
jgi:hypothetical protein